MSHLPVMHIKLVILLLQNGANLPSLVSWRLKDCHMHYVWYLSCLQARTKEITSKYLPDKITQQNHSTRLHFKKQGNAHTQKKNRLNFCEVKKEFHAGLCIFQPHKNRHFDHFFFSIKCLPLLKIFVIIVLLQCLLRRLYPKRYHDYSNGGHFRFST